jgi:hypothetical protein
VEQILSMLAEERLLHQENGLFSPIRGCCEALM